MPQAILIVDDEPRLRARMSRIVAASGIELGVVCADGVTTAQAQVEAQGMASLRLALVDLRLADGDGIDLIRWLHARDAGLPILVVSAWSAQETILEALRAGASGYVLKERDDVEIGLSVRNVLAGGAPIDPFIARRILGLIGGAGGGAAAGPASAVDETLRTAISEREHEVLTLVARGLSNREIAATLSLSLWTIQSHVRSIYRKLAVGSRLRAVQEAQLRGWLAGQAGDLRARGAGDA